MGDFDKNPTAASANDAAAKEKKKLAIVGVLGAVLLGIVGYHFMSGGPAIATASSPDGNPVFLPTERTPTEALATLDPKLNPAKNLLLSTSTLPVELTTVPRNPFKISDDWKKDLVKPVVIVPPPRQVDPEPAPHIIVSHPADPGVNAADFKIAGIFRSDKKIFATLNGNLVTVGSIVGDAKVLEITEDRVVLRHKDYPGGPTTTIKLATQKLGG